MTWVLVAVGWTGLVLIDLALLVVVALRETCRSRRQASDEALSGYPDWEK